MSAGVGERAQVTVSWTPALAMRVMTGAGVGAGTGATAVEATPRVLAAGGALGKKFLAVAANRRATDAV